MQDVAKRLDVSTGLIHYHFDNKDALLSAAFQLAAERDLERLERELGNEPGPVAKLLRVITLYAPEQAEPGWMMWIDAWGEALRNPILRAISQDLDIAWMHHLEAVIEEGVAEGAFECADPHAERVADRRPARRAGRAGDGARQGGDPRRAARLGARGRGDRGRHRPVAVRPLTGAAATAPPRRRPATR